MTGISLDSFFGQDGIVNSFAIGQFLSQEIFTPKDLDVTYTNINYWDKQGILSSRRTGKTAWRNFNFIDYVWIKVIDELRELGVPTWLIKEAKNVFFQPVKIDYKKLYNDFKNNVEQIRDSLPYPEERKEEVVKLLLGRFQDYSPLKAKKDGFTYLTYAICTSISKKIPVSLVFFKDGGCGFWHENRMDLYSKADIENLIFETQVRVSISKIIKDFLLDEKSVFLLPQLPLLQQNEKRLLELVHSGNYDSISIRFKDKKMKSLELLKTQDTKRKVADILMDGAYQDIIMKSHKGMITHIENTVKVMFDEK